MARTVGVLFIHGIRVNKPDYSKPIREAVRRRLGKLSDHAKFDEVFWADIVRPKQDAYLSGLEKNRINPKGAFRHFVIQGLGDAAAYSKPGSGRAGVYHDIQDRIRAKLKQLESRGDPDRPLVIVAHSLGCHIMSSFLWDMRKLRCLPPERRGDQRYEGYQNDFDDLDGGTPLRRLETVAGIVTFGNNMPIFAFSYPGTDIYTVNCSHGDMPPAFPGARVQGAALDAAKWINIYSRRDPLGYPLHPLTENYANDARITDVPYAVEGPLSPPFFGMLDAHTKYWNSRFVARRTSELVEALIKSD